MYLLKGNRFATCIRKEDNHIITVYSVSNLITCTIIEQDRYEIEREILIIFKKNDIIYLLVPGLLIQLDDVTHRQIMEPDGDYTYQMGYTRKSFIFDVNDMKYKALNIPFKDYYMTKDGKYIILEKEIYYIYDLNMRLKICIDTIPIRIYDYKNKIILVYLDHIYIGSEKRDQGFQIDDALLMGDYLVCLSGDDIIFVNIDIKIDIENAYHDVVFRFKI